MLHQRQRKAVHYSRFNPSTDTALEIIDIDKEGRTALFLTGWTHILTLKYHFRWSDEMSSLTNFEKEMDVEEYDTDNLSYWS